MKKVAFMLLAAGTLVFTGCTKTGPPGPQGPQGPSGPTGQTGNANVLGSDPFTVSSWLYSSSEVAYYQSFTSGDITPDVANGGIVEGYLKYADGTWRNLPDIVGGTQFFLRYSAGGFEIYYANLDGSIPANPGTQVFRIVVVSPSMKQANPNTNWKNFNEAMTAIQSQNTKNPY